MREITQNITTTDIAIVALLLMLTIIVAGAGWQQVSAEVKWWRWSWERMRYSVKGSNKFVRRPKKGEDMLLKMQHHYGDSDYQTHEFDAPVLSEREKLQRDMEKMNEKKPKKRRKHEAPPVGDDDIPVDTGSYDTAQFEEFYKEKFNLDTTP